MLRVKQVTYKTKIKQQHKYAKAKKNLLRILKIYAFCQKIQQRTSGPGQSVAGVTYLIISMHP